VQLGRTPAQPAERGRLPRGMAAGAAAREGAAGGAGGAGARRLRPSRLARLRRRRDGRLPGERAGPLPAAHHAGARGRAHPRARAPRDQPPRRQVRLRQQAAHGPHHRGRGARRDQPLVRRAGG